MSHVAAALGFDTVTLDNNPKTDPDILTDILTWEFREKRWGVFDYIHASIPCEEFSMCHTRSDRNLPLARQIADRTRQIIDHFLKLNSRCLFTIENPSTSLLCREAAVSGLNCVESSYCTAGYPYRKNTKFWTNIPGLMLKTCSPEHCFWGGRGHPASVQDAPPEMRARIPACLCFEILTCVCKAMGGTLRARIPLRPMQTGGSRRQKPEATRAPIHKKRGRPSHDREGLSCSVCSTESARQFYNVANKAGEPIMCSCCYRRTRRHAKEAAHKKETDA